MKKISLFLLFLSFNLHAASECSDLEMGASIKVTNVGKSKTGISQKYSLRRQNERTWQVFVNIDFKPTKEATGKKSTVILETRKRTQECYDEYAKHLYDEKGRKLRLFLYDRSKHKHLVDRPREANIKIIGAKERSYSDRWAQGVGCGTIVHETFHLLGLVDEYHERSIKSGNKTAYNCRHLGPKDSIMRSITVNQFLEENVIYSGQLDAIIYPNCREKNNQYYRCSENAYKTAKSCPSSPSVCYDESWVLN
ncbi:hypothetical protein [Bacteriovorax sp. BSW11_IV]|uniref:hypothetical protein n=1 Tax=Bacteriovorax sp. BSW11_IV TaxID=1353529 RepID=UPI00041D3E5E|nr:hypothetical protein [Bacteriovorax sp. BSW11_IV]